MIYRVYYDRATRYMIEVEADSPEDAIDRFWADEDAGDVGDLEVEIDGSGPTDLALTNIAGDPITWGGRTDLS